MPRAALRRPLVSGAQGLGAILGKLNDNWTRVAMSAAVLVLFLVHATDTWRFEFIEQMENLAYDSHLEFTMPRTVDDSVVIVDIDEASLTAEGRWPWSRDKLAHLLDRLFHFEWVQRYPHQLHAWQHIFIPHPI